MYTIKDVIIDRDNKEIKEAIGKECFTGKTPYECLDHANNKENIHILKKIHKKNRLPFEIESQLNSITSKYPCIIIK